MYTCHCENGYTGYDCSVEIDECQSSPCVHGKDLQFFFVVFICHIHLASPLRVSNACLLAFSVIPLNLFPSS